MRFLLFALLFCSLPAAATCIVTDDYGAKVSLAEPAKRVISLAPDLTELLFAVDAGKAVVGVIAGSDYPLEAEKIQHVGTYQALDLERILALHPDLIVAWGENSAQQVAILKQLSLPVFVSHTQHLLDLPALMQRLGCLVGKQAAAERLAKAFLQRHQQLKASYGQASRPKIRVFYELSAYPLITINRRSWINDAIKLCGGANIFADEGRSQQTAFAVSMEAVVQANPELIIADLQGNWQQQWQNWPRVAAVKNRRLLSINPDLLERAGPRILDGVELLCQAMPGAERRPPLTH